MGMQLDTCSTVPLLNTVLARRMFYAHTVQQNPHCNTLQNRISLCRSKIKAGLITIDRTNQNLLDTSALVNGGERQRRDDDSLRIFVTQKHLLQNFE
mmetsp:Transcript_65618/g.106362  ORF Transcript_65618/g.106362 Transcript_65618/m.106362 type:complete len:97 (+) Transcript_65618:1040-1330(+)